MNIKITITRNNLIKVLVFAVTFFFAAICSAKSLKSVAFYYGHNIPIDELHAFDAVIVEPSEYFNPLSFDTKSSSAFAYVSVGELNPNSFYAKEIPEKWLMGAVKKWQTKILDQR